MRLGNASGSHCASDTVHLKSGGILNMAMMADVNRQAEEQPSVISTGCDSAASTDAQHKVPHKRSSVSTNVDQTLKEPLAACEYGQPTWQRR